MDDSSAAHTRLARPVTLHMQGDWGQANLHRICGWLSQQLGGYTGSGSRFAIWNGRGGFDAFDALLDGSVDMALFVPAVFARSVVEGRLDYRPPGLDRVRALATFPQDDRLVLAVDAALGVASLEDIRRERPRLQLATGRDDGINTVGHAASRLLEAAGIGRDRIEAWGGRCIDGEAPWDVIPLATNGTANAVLFEAVMTNYWRDLAAARQMVFIPIDGDVLEELEERYLWPRARVEAGWFGGQERAFETLDFSDFLLLVREDFPEDLAYVTAACACETKAMLERQYQHIPPAQSPLTYPLRPERMAKSGIALHPGARTYYRERGLAD